MIIFIAVYFMRLTLKSHSTRYQLFHLLDILLSIHFVKFERKFRYHKLVFAVLYHLRILEHKQMSQCFAQWFQHGQNSIQVS